MTDCTLCVYTFDASTSAYCQWRDLGWSGNCYTADEIGSNGWTGIQNSAGCPSTTTTTTPTTTKSVEPLERGGPCAVNYGCSSCVLSSWHAYASGYVYVDCVWDSVDYKCVMSNDTLLMPSYTVEYSSDCSSTYIYGTVTSTALSGVAIFFIVFGGCICCCGLVVVVLCSQKKRRPMALFGCAILTTGASYSTCAPQTDCTSCVVTCDDIDSVCCEWHDYGSYGYCYTSDEIDSNGWSGIKNSWDCPSKSVERGGPCVVNYDCSSCVLSSWYSHPNIWDSSVDCVWDSSTYECVMSNDTMLSYSSTVTYSSDCPSTWTAGSVASAALGGIATFFIVFGGCICCCGLVVVVLCSQKKRRPMPPPANGGAPYTQMNDVSAQPAQPQTVVIQQPFPQQYNQAPPPQYTSIAQPQQQYQIMPQHQVQHIPQQNAAPYEAAQVPSAPYNPGYTQQ
eukprot:CAMPEP_0202730888 /NCGR_PEP_ID=MMETSP1385-20130828/186865_1 /ASSEMBLY_ACC=CAM_ASM_000861 /TAXON_ID=933848 /ORGANISM="Elphidium margaritaceum" /LENGTH=449 /DNA_ID=CAMNT_0049397169 /DNA_START=121 /DNA_END=1470 /DNA_ORIENTATION=+